MRRGLALVPGLVQFLQILGPVQRLLAPQFVEVAPVVEARIVAVVEHDLDRVLADRHQVDDVYVLFVDFQFRLLSPVPAHLGRRRVDPQELGRIVEGLPVLELDLQFMGLLVQDDIGGSQLAHGAIFGRWPDKAKFHARRMAAVNEGKGLSLTRVKGCGPFVVYAVFYRTTFPGVAMLGEKHDLIHELPEFHDLIHELKVSDPEFRRLYDEYHEVEHEVRRIEENVEVASDEYLEERKKLRLKLKDALFEILEKTREARQAQA